MGDSEQPDTGPPFVAVGQTGAVFTSSAISQSTITVTNFIFNAYYNGSPGTGRPDTGQQQEENGSEDDERKDLINSLSDSHEVHRDADLQENAEGAAPEPEDGATSGRPTPTHLSPHAARKHLTVYEEEISISNASDTYVNIQIEEGTLNDAVFSCGDGRPVEELLEEAMNDISSAPSLVEVEHHSQEDEGTAIEEPCEVPKPRLDSTLSPNEMPFKGNQMPVDSSCTIVPHPCEVYSAKAWKCTRPFGSVGNFIRKGFKSSRRICLFGNVVCISSSTQDVIKYVVDLTKERLCLNGCDLTVGQWVVILPESKLSEWKAVSVEIKSRTHPGGAQWRSSPDVQTEETLKVRSLPQASSYAGLLEDEELAEPEECKSTDQPVLLLGSPSTECFSSSDLR